MFEESTTFIQRTLLDMHSRIETDDGVLLPLTARGGGGGSLLNTLRSLHTKAESWRKHDGHKNTQESHTETHSQSHIPSHFADHGSRKSRVQFKSTSDSNNPHPTATVLKVPSFGFLGRIIVFVRSRVE